MEPPAMEPPAMESPAMEPFPPMAPAEPAAEPSWPPAAPPGWPSAEPPAVDTFAATVGETPAEPVPPEGPEPGVEEPKKKRSLWPWGRKKTPAEPPAEEPVTEPPTEEPVTEAPVEPPVEPPMMEPFPPMPMEAPGEMPSPEPMPVEPPAEEPVTEPPVEPPVEPPPAEPSPPMPMEAPGEMPSPEPMPAEPVPAPPAEGEAEVPKKKNKWWLWVGGGCLILLLIGCVFAVFSLGLVGKLAGSVAAPYAKLQSDLVKIKAGSASQVYDGASAGFKANTTSADFQKFVDSTPALKDFTGQGNPDIKIDKNISVIKLDLRGPTGTERFEFQYVEEGGEWRLQYIGKATAG
jgi:hypothetical protein